MCYVYSYDDAYLLCLWYLCIMSIYFIIDANDAIDAWCLCTWCYTVICILSMIPMYYLCFILYTYDELYITYGEAYVLCLCFILNIYLAVYFIYLYT